MAKHTKEQCFLFSDWWADAHKKGTKVTGSEKGKASAALSNKDNAEKGDDRKNTSFSGMVFSCDEAMDGGNRFEGLISNLFATLNFSQLIF